MLIEPKDLVSGTLEYSSEPQCMFQARNVVIAFDVIDALTDRSRKKAVRNASIGRFSALSFRFYDSDTRSRAGWPYQPSASENLLVADSSASFIFARFAASISFN